MADSAIEWTDATWNPTTGCDQVSPGCDNCYALTMAGRLKAMGSPAYQQDGDPRTSGPGFALQMHEDRLDQPLRWTRPRRIFVNSMSDLFHPRVTDEFIATVWDVMEQADHHTFQVLTKRPKRARAFLTARAKAATPAGRPHAAAPNVWLGTSVEDQQRADERIPPLLDTPAAVRFLSCEPLLGPVDLTGYLGAGGTHDDPYGFTCARCGAQDAYEEAGHPIDPTDDEGPWCPGPMEQSPCVHWVIVGGESGPHARPMHPQWARDLRDQATAAGVPYFFKQWGAWRWAREVSNSGYEQSLPEDVRDRYLRHEVEGVALDGSHVSPAGRPPYPDGTAWMMQVDKREAGRELDGRTWDEFPQEAAHA